MRWKMRTECPAGPAEFLATGKPRFHAVIDENGEFETEGLPEFPLWIYAKRIKGYPGLSCSAS